MTSQPFIPVPVGHGGWAAGPRLEGEEGLTKGGTVVKLAEALQYDVSYHPRRQHPLQGHDLRQVSQLCAQAPLPSALRAAPFGWRRHLFLAASRASIWEPRQGSTTLLPTAQSSRLTRTSWQASTTVSTINDLCPLAIPSPCAAALSLLLAPLHPLFLRWLEGLAPPLQVGK